MTASAAAALRRVLIEGNNATATVGADPHPYIAVATNFERNFLDTRIEFLFDGIKGQADVVCPVHTGGQSICNYVLNGSVKNREYQCCARADVPVGAAKEYEVIIA